MFEIKDPNINSFNDLNEYLQDLEKRIESAFLVGEFDVINISPASRSFDKPKNGDVINADGTNYDPGNGPGLYLYTTNYNKV